MKYYRKRWFIIMILQYLNFWVKRISDCTFVSQILSRVKIRVFGKLNGIEFFITIEILTDKIESNRFLRKMIEHWKFQSGMNRQTLKWLNTWKFTLTWKIFDLEFFTLIFRIVEISIQKLFGKMNKKSSLNLFIDCLLSDINKLLPFQFVSLYYSSCKLLFNKYFYKVYFLDFWKVFWRGQKSHRTL